MKMKVSPDFKNIGEDWLHSFFKRSIVDGTTATISTNAWCIQETGELQF